VLIGYQPAFKGITAAKIWAVRDLGFCIHQEVFTLQVKVADYKPHFWVDRSGFRKFPNTAFLPPIGNAASGSTVGQAS
jgi:hypothetical protein